MKEIQTHLLHTVIQKLVSKKDHASKEKHYCCGFKNCKKIIFSNFQEVIDLGIHYICDIYFNPFKVHVS